MTFRLRLLSLYMPRFLMGREVERIRARTFAAMDELLSAHGVEVPDKPGPTGRGLEDRRADMALGHQMRAEALVKSLGEERAVAVARDALFDTGVQLGMESRRRLRMDGSAEDLIRAAKVMYRVLGIEFTLSDSPQGKRLEVHRCALASRYSSATCRMLSAVDEGTVSGLDPQAEMRFQERITGGAPRCVATIRFGGKG